MYSMLINLFTLIPYQVSTLILYYPIVQNNIVYSIDKACVIFATSWIHLEYTNKADSILCISTEFETN